VAVLQSVNISENQRLDKEDFENIEKFVCADFHQQSKKFFNPSSLVVKGFFVSQDQFGSNLYPTTSPVYVSLDGSVLMHSSKNTGPSFYVGPKDYPASQVVLTSNAINYIEVDLTVNTDVPDNKAFWDPTANSNQGEEFVQTTDTVKNLEAVVTVNTSGFAGGTKIPIAEIQVNNVGTIVAIYDRRNMFFRLATGQPYDGDKESSYVEGRYEAIHTITLGASPGAFVFSQPTPSSTWNITHNLSNQYVHFTFYDTNKQVLLPNTVTTLDANSATVDFTVPQAGYCLITIGQPTEYYLHTQGVGATTWNVAHNLGNQYNNVSVFSGTGVMLIPNTITATNANNLSINFTTSQVGFAIVSKKGSLNGGYLHNQGIASLSWNINHNLQSLYVTPTFYNTSNQVIIPSSLTAVDANNTIATFATAQDGFAFLGKGSGGDYLVGETVQGLTSNTTAVVTQVQPLVLTVHGKNGVAFTIGEVLIGLTSSASYSILTVKESFLTSDKSFNTLKESLDAIMTEIKKIKWGTTPNKYWFQEIEIDLYSLSQGGLKARGYIADDGISATLSNSIGINSVVLLGVGQIQVNWSTPFTGTDYQVFAQLEGGFGSACITTKNSAYVIVDLVDFTNTHGDTNFSISAYGA